MTKWKLSTYLARPGTVTSRIWEEKDQKRGTSDWEEVQKLARRGWELVSVTPTILDGSTTGFLYTFKKPIEGEQMEEGE